MGIRNNDVNRRSMTLDHLEGVSSDDPVPGDTSLVTRCLQLRKKPIGQFSIEDLRIMIGQDIGLLFLIPLAIEQLNVDPFAEGNYYPGDLFCSCLRANSEFWCRQSRLRGQLEEIISKIKVEVDVHIADAMTHFRQQ